jgi:hypothetical protein
MSQMILRSAVLPAIVVALLLVGCATDPQPVVVVETVEPEAEPESTVVESEPETAGPEPDPPVAEPEAAESRTAETQPDAPEAQVDGPVAPIEVPEEVYNQAFSEVEAVIEELNQIIYHGEFETWKTFLTERYLEYHSNPAVLAEISRQPILAQNGIRLRNLKDYFEDVVIPSRARAKPDDLIFYSDTLVEAVTEFRGQRVILYLLRKIDGEWKIDTQETLTPEQESAGQG